MTGRRVHNHGPAEGRGLDCPERLVGACLDQPEPTGVREGRYQATDARALWFCVDDGAVVPIEARDIHDAWHDDRPAERCETLDVCQPDDADDAERIIQQPDAMTEWFTAYGVRLMTVGEDGDWLALGHVEPLRMVAAMRRAAREQLRLDDEEIFGDYRDRAPLAVVEHLRAYFTEHDECGWYAHWGDEAQGHPAAVDVTVWRA